MRPTRIRDKKMKKLKLFTILTLALSAAVLTGCYKMYLSEPEPDTPIVIDPPEPEPGEILGIPNDSKAGPNPTIGSATTQLPNFQTTVKKEAGHSILSINMTGIYDQAAKQWLRLAGTGGSDGNAQNVWLSINGKPKGILVYNSTDGPKLRAAAFMADVVFLVDNSGSMGEEADAVAEGIVTWATFLEEKSGLDLYFGCVGYGYNSDVRIYGAIDITDVYSLENYLRYPGKLGINRTLGYDGPNAADLQQWANSYGTWVWNGGECGVLALRFADERFSFRNGALRTYVNFTDEPNQPGGNKEWSVEYVNDQENWGASKGTIHTVFSADTTYVYNWSDSYIERPWLMSEYTGGTKMFTSSEFDVDLNELPVTGALQNSYEIRAVVDEYMDGRNCVITLTVKDGYVGGVKSESTILYYAE